MADETKYTFHGSQTPNPGKDLRSVYYQAADGIQGLMDIAKKVQDSDAEFHRLVKQLNTSRSHLLVHLNATYNWD